jgi:CRP/FNR family cyclic AMP-dependent transcriptional regulator
MSIPPTNGNPSPGGVPTTRLQKGQFIFKEGENAGSIYLLKTGNIRIFKKKGNSDIEIETIRSGQILGELAFLDGNPRSASGEALTDCDLVEISGPSFQQVLDKLPEWLKILLRTLVTRLRVASTRIRQLESASTEFVYSEKEGRRVSQYVYLTTAEVMKTSAALLLVASRWGKPTEIAGKRGIDIKIALLQRYVNQIMQVPIAKLTSVVDAFTQAGFLKADDASGNLVLTDVDFLESLIHYMNEENLREPTKRHDISNKGFLIMVLIAKYLPKIAKDPNGSATVNLAEILKLETPPEAKPPFRIDEFAELITLGYGSNIAAKSNDEVLTTVNADEFMLSVRLQRTLKCIEAVNEQKANKA